MRVRITPLFPFPGFLPTWRDTCVVFTGVTTWLRFPSPHSVQGFERTLACGTREDCPAGERAGADGAAKHDRRASTGLTPFTHWNGGVFIEIELRVSRIMSFCSLCLRYLWKECSSMRAVQSRGSVTARTCTQRTLCLRVFFCTAFPYCLHHYTRVCRLLTSAPFRALEGVSNS